MPARRKVQQTFTCPQCNLQVTLTKNTATIKRKKSAKRVARGKRLAAQLPRDSKGKFKKFGEVDEFRGKTKRTRQKGKEREGPSGKPSRRRFS